MFKCLCKFVQPLSTLYSTLKPTLIYFDLIDGVGKAGIIFDATMTKVVAEMRGIDTVALNQIIG